MAKSPGSNSKTSSLLRIVEQRATSNREDKKQQENSVPYLHEDCISNILGRLPIESLPRVRFVCKPWFNVINSDRFIDNHLRRSETVLIFLRFSPIEISNSFSVEEHLIQSQSIFQRSILRERTKFYMNFMEINEDGTGHIKELNVSCLGKIKASCNGLVLLENKLKRGGVQVINPVTRQLVALPLGTLFPSHDEAYGFAFNASTKEYKVVHLFRDELGFIGCEIIVLGTRSWRPVNGPSFGLFGWFGYDPVFAIGALHWIPQIDRSDYIVSMSMDDEQFHTIPLPTSSRRHDGLVEIGGLLCFVNHVIPNQMEIWVMTDFHGKKWIKQHTIIEGCIMDMVPIAGSRNGGVVIFRRDEDYSFYAYDIELQEMRDLEIKKEHFSRHGTLVPHINSLISWETARDQIQADM